MKTTWMSKLLRYPELWVLTVVALVTRLWQFQLPPAVVFDEVYFRTFAGNYLNGEYFFDIHPPFVKLLFAGAASVLGIQPDQLINGDPAATVLRVIPALAGVALVPLVYVIVRQLGLGRRVASIGALLVLLDNALLVESRFVLMDSLLLLTSFGALSCYLALRKNKGVRRWVWVIVMAILLGLSASTKWSGLAMTGFLGLVWLVEGIRSKVDWRRLLGEATATLLIIVTIYVSSFMVHFALLPKSGEGDAFMSQKFQSLLVDNASYNKDARMTFWDKFVELNKEMFTSQSTIGGHDYASYWYEWPLELRSIYYWQGVTGKDDVQGNIYLLGNPVVWWASAVSVITLIVVWVGAPKQLGNKRRVVAFLLAGYALHFVPFAFINRPMFLYHYLSALIFAILLTCVLLWFLFDWQMRRFGQRAVTQTSWMMAIVVLLGFLYFVPLSYGWPLTPAELQQHMWLPTWR